MKHYNALAVAIFTSILAFQSCSKNQEYKIGLEIYGYSESLDINPIDPYEFSVITHYPLNTPEYKWETTDPSIVEAEVNQYNDAYATISASGNIGDKAILRVSDIANDYSKEVEINIVESPYGELIDERDGTEYLTIQIGSQLWMAQNLNFETDSGSWAYDDDLSNISVYGRLYDWETAMKSCPEGWHLPSLDEWLELENYLMENDYYLPYNDLSESLSATFGWFHHNIEYDYQNYNNSGFRMLPGGAYFNSSSFDFSYNYKGTGALFWTSSKYPDSRAGGVDEILYKMNYKMNSRLSVRCLKD